MRKISVILVIAALSTGAVWAQWSGNNGDQIICWDDNLQCWYAKAAVDGEGVVHAVWAEKVVSYPTQQEIHYSRSSDNGRNWSAINQDIVISWDDGVNVENSNSLAIDSQDNIYVVWAEDDNGANEIHYTISSDGGDTWTGQQDDMYLSFRGGADAYNPEMVIDGNDVIHVVWNQDYDDVIDEIYYSRSEDGGLTWTSQTEERIISFPDGQYASYPVIAAGPNDELYVVYKEKRDILDDRWVLNVSISTDGGETWSGAGEDIPIINDFHIASYPHIAVDANGIVHVNFQGCPELPIHYECYYTRSDDGGTTWTGLEADRMISYPGAGDISVHNPNIGVDNSGGIFAVWNENYVGTDDAEPHISISTDGGVSWTGETEDVIVSSPGDHPGYRPFIAAGPDDTLHVVWNERAAGSYYQIHYSRGDAVSQAPGADVTITVDPVNPPIIIPAGGGNFDYTITITNNEAAAVTFDVWLDVMLPGGTVYGPIIFRPDINLPVGGSIVRTMTQVIPEGAPTGGYQFQGHVGQYPGQVWAEDAFGFVKE